MCSSTAQGAQAFTNDEQPVLPQDLLAAKANNDLVTCKAPASQQTRLSSAPIGSDWQVNRSGSMTLLIVFDFTAAGKSVMVCSNAARMPVEQAR